MAMAREKFATQVDPKLLADLRALAKAEGRQLQAVVDEAFADLLEKRRQGRARPHVMAAYQKSQDRFAALYDKLAQ
jgi:histidinol-phosphate/aromatic aminotransferase/cobyric acid decarboxylase-like protein